MSGLVYFFLFLFGLAIGSFLNVIIWRFKPDDYIFSLKKISGRSHCLNCQHKLSWYELIPVFSFLFLKGKCFNCKSKISFLYPFVELLVAFILIFVFYYFSNFYQIINFSLIDFLLIFLWFKVFLLYLLIFIIDFKFMIIPNEVNFSLGMLGILISLIVYFFKQPSEILNYSFLKNYSLIFPSFSPNFLVNHFLGAVIGLLFFLLIFVLTRGKGIGFGDVKLAFFSGFLFGWPDIIVVSFLSFIIGGLIGLILIFLKKKKIKDKIPFGPVFVFASLLIILFGQKILAYYFNFFDFLLF